MSKTLASVIIPHYRTQEKLNVCLESLIEQDFPADQFEIIIVQNEQRNLELKKDLKKRVFIINESKPGSYRARNSGALVAQSENLFFTDADCRPSKDWLKRGLEYLNQGHNIVGGHIELMFQNPDCPKPIELYEKVFYFNQDISIHQESYAATANLIVRKDIFYEVGPFDASLMSGGDREWGRRAFQKGQKIFYAYDAIVYHPSRTKIFECFQRRIRIASNHLYIRMRKYGLNAEGKKVLKKRLLMPPTPESWPANWLFFNTLTDKQKKRVLNFHRIFVVVDYLIVTFGHLNFKLLKTLTKIDRVRLK